MYDMSIIIATKNEQEYIGKTLEHLSSSITEAEKLNIKVELIVIDSSNDNTLNIAKNFTKKVYKFSLEGVSKARNYGAKMARGKILIFMDADTIVQKNTLTDIFKIFQNKSVVSVITYVLPAVYNKLPFSAKIFYALDRMFIKACGKIKILIKFYNRGDIIAIRKLIFNKIDGFDERLYMMEITNLLVKASKHGLIKVLSTPVFESGRRLRKWGLIKSYKIWWRNYFTYYILKRLYDVSYEAVR
jgi:glycosyltransferase involved in cell wall biosynthesis